MRILMNMKNKVTLVTGGALGYKTGGPSIGSEIAFKFASEGANVVVIDIKEDMGKKTADKIIEEGGNSLFIKTDVSKAEQVIKAIEITKQEFGRLDFLINCAATYGYGISKNVVDISEEDWNNTINVNLNGYFRFATYAIPVILESGGGAIVNISSGAAFKVMEIFCVYSVTKAAINSLTRSLAIDFAPQIRTNAICPGFVRIENSEGDRNPSEMKDWIDGISKSYPMKRVYTAEEITNVAYFHTSDPSS